MADEKYVPSLEDLISFADDENFTPDVQGSTDPTTEEIVDDAQDEHNSNDDGNTDVTNEPDEILGDGDLEGNEDQVPTEDEEEPTEEDSTEEVTDEEFKEQLSRQYEFLTNQGLIAGLPEDFEFDGSPEKFQEAIETSKAAMQNVAVQQIWQALPYEFQVAFEYALSGGTELKQVQKFVTNQVNYDDFDLENMEDQKWLIENHLRKTTKLSDTKIQKQLKYWMDTDTLEEEAEAALQELKQIQQEEKKNLLQEQAKQKEEQEKALMENYNTFKSSLESVNDYDERKKEQIIRSIWHPQKIEGREQTYFNYIDYKIKSNPEHLAQLASIYLDYDPEKGFNMSEKAATKQETKVMTSFRDNLRQLLGGTNSVHKSSASSQPGVENFDMEKFLQFGE